jgi:hypothetical protein
MAYFYGKSNRAMLELIAKSNRVLVLKGDFGKSNRAMRKIIAKTNHVLFFKVDRLCLERERMYALCTSGNSGYEAH